MDFDDFLRTAPGALMQAIDVLGDERMQPATPFEFSERAMSRVRFRRPSGMIDSRSPS
jgi:hypothetical protein